MQPFVDVGIAAGPGAHHQRGIWNSLHSGPSGSDHEGGDRSAWYELDFYASATFQVGKVKPGVLFTSYTSPNDAFATVQELAVVLAFDDSGNTFPLNPKAILAFELDGQADGGSEQGHLSRARRPAGRPARRRTTKYPLTLAIPAKIGSQPERLLRGRQRQRHLRLLRSRRHPQRAARLHEWQDDMGNPRRAGRALARRQHEGPEWRRWRQGQWVSSASA